eukprot:CAMPEP_0168610886 /NCGR_PEP_ID=MMETSP0449_2-20121227/2041_1 /TAXON_ID=1082188 /ORGANISM="Strombidium rassoulzadegani, Strain ras09" /LENGTH=128 /DNA_ID=CAMNT_0008651251 /DNA_START=35 /DNA_END=420 /DNA_ORIENTATION=+
MAYSRTVSARSNAYHSNVHKRGAVPTSRVRKDEGGSSVGPVMIGFFLFVVVGSALLQVISTATLWAALLSARLHPSSPNAAIPVSYRTISDFGELQAETNRRQQHRQPQRMPVRELFQHWSTFCAMSM